MISDRTMGSPVSGAQARPFGLADLGSISLVSSPQIAPDGDSVVVVVSRPDYESNTHVSRLVLVDVASGQSRDLTSARPSVHRPRWSPSGEYLAFIANNDTTEDSLAQVFVLPINGGESRVVTSAPRGVASFEWSIDSEEIFFVAAGALGEKPEGPERHNQSFVVTHHDYLARERPPELHAWRIPIQGGNAERINDQTVLVQHGQFSSFSVSGDGSAIVFSGFPAEHPGDFTKMQLYVVDLETGKPRSFTDQLDAIAWGEVSPDGRRLAVSRPLEGIWIFRSHEIAMADANGGQLESVSSSIDRSLWGAAWMPDSQSLLIGARDGARNSIWHQPLVGAPTRLALGELEPVTSFGPVDLDIGRNGQVAFVATTSQRPAELYWLDTIESAPKALTDFNAAVGALDMSPSEEIRWQTEDGFDANGILTYPPGFDRHKTYPLVLKIHGGPMSGSTKRFDELSRLLAARGFVVFEPNYRGSDNLGADFQAAVIHDAGAGPGRDVMAGTEAVIKHVSVDESRIGVSGWSYGGYMTAWLIGCYPDKWRAAVAGAPVSDYVDQYALADLNNVFANGFDHLPWSPEAQAAWRNQSPIAHIYRATTPTLILCNTGDRRVPITESYKLYHALKDHDVPVQFVAYPLDGHFPADPVHQRDVYRRWIDWFEARFDAPRDSPVGE
jgi:dipeptidyl aminopeptidase/acylaminoacyl peptidase